MCETQKVDQPEHHHSANEGLLTEEDDAGEDEGEQEAEHWHHHSEHCLNCCIDKGGVELAHFCLVLIESFVRDIGSHQDKITTYQ